jgi:hypothetical protein
MQSERTTNNNYVTRIRITSQSRLGREEDAMIKYALKAMVIAILMTVQMDLYVIDTAMIAGVASNLLSNYGCPHDGDIHMT